MSTTALCAHCHAAEPSGNGDGLCSDACYDAQQAALANAPRCEWCDEPAPCGHSACARLTFEEGRADHAGDIEREEAWS